MAASKTAAATDGYFAANSVTRRVSRELLLLLGGGRALLMQVAHPLVAAGVAEHSDYRENPWRRLEQTMRAVWTVVFGTRAEADAVGARVRSLHSTVHGRLTADAGPFPAGTVYTASDPRLLMWVHATLVDTALLVYECWIGRLGRSEQASYYEEMKVLARIFGTPEAVIPPTFDDFESYMRERLQSDDLHVTPAARDVRDSVLNPRLPLPLRPAWEPLNLVTRSLLPDRLRSEYGLGWGRGREALVGASRSTVRRALVLLPDVLRSVPPARRKTGPHPID